MIDERVEWAAKARERPMIIQMLFGPSPPAYVAEMERAGIELVKYTKRLDWNGRAYVTEIWRGYGTLQTHDRVHAACSDEDYVAFSSSLYHSTGIIEFTIVREE